MSIIIEDWGRISYRDAWEHQKMLVSQLQNNPESDEYVLLVEHDPVYTLGFHGNENNMLASQKYLESIGAECIRIERGGDVTYHGPGQLVVYPIVNLRKHGLGVKKYIELLENSVISLLQEYGIESSSNNDAIGVWLDWDKPTARKICAIGVKVSHAVTMHGLALNVNTDLKAFSLINPCGFVDKGVTSVARELKHETDFETIKQRLGEIIRNNIL